MKTRKKMKYLILMTIILCSNWTFGQSKEIKHYSGIYEGGTAAYSYYVDKNYERIYNGNFTYSDNVIKYDGLKININGNFLYNMRDGKWMFSIKSTKSPVLMLLSDEESSMLQTSLNLLIMSDPSNKSIPVFKEVLKNGSIAFYQTYNSTLSGNYIAGKLDGIWTFNEISTGGIDREMTNEKNPPIYSTVTFLDNELIGDFLYKQGKKIYVFGQFDKKGLLTGKWITKWAFRGNEYENISEYENGILIKMIEQNASTGEIISRDVQTESEGKKLMVKSITFWLKFHEEKEFKQLSVSDRNYMFRFSKGIIKPIIENKF